MYKASDVHVTLGFANKNLHFIKKPYSRNCLASQNGFKICYDKILWSIVEILSNVDTFYNQQIIISAAEIKKMADKV